MTNSAQDNKGKSKRSSAAFLDASVILSGLASGSGGSRALFEAAKTKKLKLLTTPLVVQEVAEHLDKIGVNQQDLEALFNKRTISIIPNPTEEKINRFGGVTKDPDDAHVLAGAVVSGANFLISLDKAHIVTPRVKRALRPLLVFSPKEFWNWIRAHKLKKG